MKYNGNKQKYGEKYMCCIFTIRSRKSPKNPKTHTCRSFVLSRKSVNQFTLPSANSQCNFQMLFMYHVLYFLMRIFKLYFPCVLLFLNNHNRKQVLLIKRFLLVFVKRSTIGQSAAFKLQRLQRKTNISWVPINIH